MRKFRYVAHDDCDKLALHISNKVMEMLGCSEAPDLLMTEFYISEETEASREYVAEYPCSKQENSVGSISVYVTIHLIHDKWSEGTVYIVCATGAVADTSFKVTYIGDVPEVAFDELVPSESFPVKSLLVLA